MGPYAFLYVYCGLCNILFWFKDTPYHKMADESVPPSYSMTPGEVQLLTTSGKGQTVPAATILCQPTPYGEVQQNSAAHTVDQHYKIPDGAIQVQMTTDQSKPLDTAQINQQLASLGLTKAAGQRQVIVVMQQQEEPQEECKMPMYYRCAILSMCLCICPLGVVASVFACQAAKRRLKGDSEGEQRYARPAKYITVANFLLGLAGYLTLIIVFSVYQSNK